MKRLFPVALVLCFVGAVFATEPTALTVAGGANINLNGGTGGIAGDLLWDNGDTDGTNGYSNADAGAFGYRRTCLDDFTITDPQGWELTDFHSYQIWNTYAPGSGWDYSLSFRADNGGTPGAVIATATTVSYSETATGRFWFSRPEYETNYEFAPIVLGPGTYWIEGNVVGPENNFWMIKSSVTGSECWVNYDDLGGLQSGTAIFGVPKDLSFQLTGTIVPEPASFLLLGLGVLALRRR
ncbi:MAG: PEP-CTERM sorting domain-containing protein [Planctomycetes bacterium]|nr:PEP-CTERM sorting domain-containing protein [Planctomycetota bacterium]